MATVFCLGCGNFYPSQPFKSAVQHRVHQCLRCRNTFVRTLTVLHETIGSGPVQVTRQLVFVRKLRAGGNHGP